MKNNNMYIVFSLFGVVVILWHLLLSGYVLALDMVFGPHLDLVRSSGDILNSAPVQYTLSFFTNLLGGMITEKLLLVIIFFTLFFTPLYFFKKLFSFENTYGSEYVASLLFVCNPFVYERFLAGHWMVLFGYALLIPVISYTFDFSKSISWKTMMKVLAILLLIGAISIHYLIISSIVVMLILTVNLVRMRGSASFLAKSVVLFCGVLVGSSYWILPLFFTKSTVISSFTPAHWDVFKTVGSGSLSAIENVMSLQGFWLEGQPWAEQFQLPKDGGGVMHISFFLLITLIVVGIYAGVKNIENRGKVFIILGTMLMAVIFSVGVGDSIFKNFNMWLFENISFWRGFRDTQKWSGVIALSYALFIGIGAQFILSRIKTSVKRKVIVVLFASLPLLSTPMMLFGFSGQLQPVMYPESWNKINLTLKEDKECTAIFLPWRQYYSLSFNNNLLTANISRNYFDCEILDSRSMDIVDPRTQNTNDEKYKRIEMYVTNNTEDAEKSIEIFKNEGIRYIIYTNDIEHEDSYRYKFLKSLELKRLFQEDGAELYQIK